MAEKILYSSMRKSYRGNTVARYPWLRPGRWGGCCCKVEVNQKSDSRDFFKRVCKTIKWRRAKRGEVSAGFLFKNFFYRSHCVQSQILNLFCKFLRLENEMGLFACVQQFWILGGDFLLASSNLKYWGGLVRKSPRLTAPLDSMLFQIFARYISRAETSIKCFVINKNV